MTHRSAVLSDQSRIVEFQVAMAEETEGLGLDRGTVEKGVRAVFEDPSKGQYFVTERDGKVIASLLITYEWSDWRDGNVWWIQSVYVDPAHRRDGVFSGLYSHVQAIVKARTDLRGLRLYVDKRNSRAQRTYARIGMNGDHYHLYEWMKTF